MTEGFPAVEALPPVLIGASSKAYLGLAESLAWARTVAAGLPGLGGGSGAYLCMPAPLLGAVGPGLVDAGMLVGVQDVSAYPPGAHTGETTAELLAELGARLVMIGHPERARDQHESLEDCRGKALAAARNGIVPILIAGEPTRGADPEAVIGPQLDTVLADVPSEFPVIIAYEPSWAIGQPDPAPGDHVAATTTAIRQLLADRGRGSARIVYGGSAVLGTYTAIVAAADAAGDKSGRPDGIFLGRSGLSAKTFLDAVAEVRSIS